HPGRDIDREQAVELRPRIVTRAHRTAKTVAVEFDGGRRAGNVSPWYLKYLREPPQRREARRGEQHTCVLFVRQSRADLSSGRVDERRQEPKKELVWGKRGGLAEVAFVLARRRRLVTRARAELTAKREERRLVVGSIGGLGGFRPANGE